MNVTPTLRIRRGLLASTLALALAACGTSSTVTTVGDPGSSTATTTAGSAATSESQAAPDEGFDCESMAAAFATTGSANDDLPDPQASATCEGDTVVVSSNGIPDFTYVETSPGVPRENDLEFTLPAAPAIADEVTAIPLLGAVAVAVNGIPIYGPTEGQGADVLSLEGGLSECGSHNGPTGFHYHLHQTADGVDCLHTPEDVEDGAQLFGFSFDGFPIYAGNGDLESSWELTDAALFDSDTWAAHSHVEGSGDLDECNGLVDDAGHYAYYTTDDFPYVLGCYRGVVDLETARGGTRP